MNLATRDLRPDEAPAWSSGVFHEPRNQRQYVRVPVRMTIGHGGRFYDGTDLSLDGFTITGGSYSPLTSSDSKFAIYLTLAGFEIFFVVEAQLAFQQQEGTRFRFTQVEDKQLELIRKIVRAHLSGQLARFEQLVTPEDAETPLLSGGVDLAAKAPRRRLRFALLGLFVAALVLVTTEAALQKFSLTHASFASVTAPRLELKAEIAGRVEAAPVRLGDMVERDQVLGTVVNPELEATRLATLSSLRYSEATVERLRMLPPDLQFTSGRSVEEELFEALRDVELHRGQLAGLDLRRASGVVHAGCPCRVFSTKPAGEFVAEGDLLFTLVGTDPADLMVEALVPLASVSSLAPGDRARIRGEGIDIRGEVKTVVLDGEVRSRAGIPAALRDDRRNLAVVTVEAEGALRPEAVGRPLEVVFVTGPTMGEGMRHIADAVTGALWPGAGQE